MVAELAHTSALAGIDPGTSGFTTVVRTSGMSGETRRTLEQLSAYKADGNPAMPIFGHRIVSVAARPIHVVTLIQPCGLDHSGRQNRIAWHLAFEASEIVNCELLGALDWLVERTNTWDQTPAIVLDPPTVKDNGEQKTDPEAWSSWGCDVGWASALAHLSCHGTPTAVIVPQEVDLIRIVKEIVRTVAPKSRWQATVSTGSSGLEPNTTLNLVIVHEGTQAANRLNAGVARNVLELPATELPAIEGPEKDSATVTPPIGKSQMRPLRETHAYLFEEPPTKTPVPATPANELEADSEPLEAPEGVSKILIVLIAIGIIALVGMLVLVLS